MIEGNFLPRWVSIGLIPLINLLLAFLVSGIVILFIGENPFQAILVMIKQAQMAQIKHQAMVYMISGKSHKERISDA